MATSGSISDYFKFNPIITPPTSGGFSIGSGLKPASAPINFKTPLAPMSPSLANIAAGRTVSPVTPATPVAPPALPPRAPVAPPTPAAPVPPVAPTQSPVPPQWLNADGSMKTPDQIASEIGGALKTAHTSGDVGKLALDQFGGQNKSAADLEAEARRVGNTRNDIAVGETDPYKVASQSGIAYTPAELNAIEKAYAGVYDPALDTALAKVTAKQTSDKAAADAKTRQDEIKAQGEETRKNQANAPYTLGANDTRFDGNGNPIAVGSGTGGSSGTDLSYYIKTTANGNKYVDLSTVTDKNQKAALQNAAQVAGIPPVTDVNASKINAIDDTRSNLDQISSQFEKVGYENGFTKLLGGGGISNSVESFFGNADIGSFNAWRTAAINSIQALAGGTGSGLRINQAEINSAMENDIPNKNDTIAVGKAKLAVLRNQLNNWENQLLGVSGAAPAGEGGAVPAGTDGASYGFPGYKSDGTQWVQQ